MAQESGKQVKEIATRSKYWAKIAIAASEASYAVGLQGLRQFPIIAVAFLIISAAFAIGATIAWWISALRGEGIQRYPGERSQFWADVRQNLSDIRSGKAKKSVTNEFAAAGLNVLGVVLFAVFYFNPAGILGFGLVAAVDLMFLGSGIAWYRSAAFKYEEAYEEKLTEYIENSGFDSSNPDIRKKFAEMFKDMPSPELFHRNLARQNTEFAASFGVLAVCCFIIPVVGPILSAALALAAGIFTYRAYTHAREANEIALQEEATPSLTDKISPMPSPKTEEPSNEHTHTHSPVINSHGLSKEDTPAAPTPPNSPAAKRKEIGPDAEVEKTLKGVEEKLRGLMKKRQRSEEYEEPQDEPKNGPPKP